MRGCSGWRRWDVDVPLDSWLVYLLAATGLSLSPGPNGLLALTHGALHGRRRVLFTIFGGALGFVVLIAMSMFGIGALLKSSLVWLAVLKWLGGAYLVWLGIQVWRAPPIGIEPGGAAGPRDGWSMFRQGALSALTNPKGLLFFAAFLPQFIDPARSLLVQFAIMAGTFAAVEIATELFIASMAHRISPWLKRVGRRFNQACGGVFIAIGVALPLRG
jgi:threonine/homoserine/homoserine lactone efflux protein